MPEKVSDSEMEVLRILIEHGPATAAEIHRQTATERQWAYSTVVTFLRRLEAKGMAGHAQPEGSRAFVYQATLKAQSTRRTLLRQVLDRMFGGNPLPLVSSLLDETRLNETQLTELHRMLDEHAAKRRKKS